MTGSDRIGSRRVAGTLGTNLTIQLLGLVSGALLARLLGVESRGLLAAIVLWTSVVAYVGDLGIPRGYLFFSSTNPSSVPRLVANALLLTVSQGAALLAIGVPLVLFAIPNHNGARAIGVVAMLGYVPLNLLTRYLAAVHQGTGRFRRFHLIRLSVQAVYVLGVVVLFALGINRLDAVVAVILISNAAALFVATRELDWSPIRRWQMLDRGLLGRTLDYGLRAHLGSLAPIDTMRLDLALVIALLGPYEAGLYAVASSAASLVRFQASALAVVAVPAIAGVADEQEKREVTGTIVRLTFILATLSAICIAISAPILVPALFGREFAEAVLVVRILAGSAVAASLRNVLGECLRGLGRPASSTLAEVTSWIVAGGALAVLVPAFGLAGAAVAVSLSFSAAVGICLWFASRLGISTRMLVVPRRQDLALLGSLASYIHPNRRHLREVVGG